MNIYHEIFPLGIGTNRFPVAGPDDSAGIERSAQMVVSALEAGASYIDVAQTYSRGTAMAVCRKAFTQTKAPRHVTVKSSFLSDKTVDDALRRTEAAFVGMGIDHAFCFVIWNISSYEQFKAIMKKGSLYDGALLAKERGLVDHICFSSHAKAAEIAQIIESGAFEGGTIAFSPLNSFLMKPALDVALRHKVGLVAMNPLGGGVIPQANTYFSFLQCEGDDSTVTAALRYVYAHPAIKVVLSGMSDVSQLRQNLSAFTEPRQIPGEERIERVSAKFAALDGYCTGCSYCMPCPAGIDIPAFMQSRNSTLFPAAPMYNRTDPELLRSIQLFRKLQLDFSIFPEDGHCRCLDCGACEKKCTQHLSIRTYLKEIFARVNRTAFSVEARRNRLNALLNGKSYQRVGFYPGGFYTVKVLEMYTSFFGSPPFTVFLFDSNPDSWGTVVAGRTVHAPEEIPHLDLDAVIVTNFNYLDEIYQAVSTYKTQGVDIIKLHEPGDVPWVF